MVYVHYLPTDKAVKALDTGPHVCTFLGCIKLAVKRLQPPYGQPWYGCPDHYPFMQEALKVGLNTLQEVSVSDCE